VEARQRVKLTSTNRSIGLIALIVSAHPLCPIALCATWGNGDALS
jgi:hypothetical protein